VRRALLLALALATLTGCPALPSEPPPPSRKPELVPAPPNARGARAAGTDAAPKPELGFPVADDGSSPLAPTEPAPDGGGPVGPGTPDAPGTPIAPGTPTAPGTPDAGMAL
jgi:hypothetical protein